MFRIRSDQLDSLARPMRAQFAARLLDHVRENFSEQCEALDEPALTKILDELLARAHAHGFVREAALEDFVNLAFVFGLRFDEELQWARKTIASPASAELRMEALFEQGIDRAGEGTGLLATNLERGAP